MPSREKKQKTGINSSKKEMKKDEKGQKKIKKAISGRKPKQKIKHKNIEILYK